MTDALVIGAGPAGSSAAIRLARAGMKVRLYEKKRFPRAKLCGGFLGAEALQDLDQLGVLPALRAAGVHPLHRSVIVSQQGTRVEAPLPGESLSISREVMDDLLLQEARSTGVDIRIDDGFLSNDVRRYTVIATGRPVTAHTHPQLKLTPWYASPTTTYLGMQASFADIQGMTDQVELDLIESGYVGLARQYDGTVNICTLTTPQTVERYGPSLDRVMSHFIDENPILRMHLAGSKRVSEWLAVGPVHLGIRALAHDNTFYVGDAACVVDPFAGEGMAIGLYSSKLLVQAVCQTERRPEDIYSQLWRDAFVPALRWNALIRLFYSFKLLREPVLYSLKRYPEAMTWLTDLTRLRPIEGLF